MAIFLIQKSLFALIVTAVGYTIPVLSLANSV